MKKCIPYFLLFSIFNPGTLKLAGQIQVSIDTIKMKWVENHCPTESRSAFTFKWKRKVVVSDAIGNHYKWDFKWDQVVYSSYLFDKLGGTGMTTDTFTLHITDWAKQGFPAIPGTADIPLTFFEVGNPSNKSTLILHIERIKEYTVREDNLLGYPKACHDTTLGDHGLYPLSISVQNDFSGPGNITTYKQGDTYIDQNFGSEVTVVSGHASFHGYAYPTPFSAHSKYIMVHRAGATVYDFVSPQGVNQFSIPISALDMGQNDMGYMWDGTDDNILYAINDHNKLKKFDLRTMSYTTLIDFSQAPYNFRNEILAPWHKGAFEMSRDNWLSFNIADTIITANNETYYFGKLVAVNLNSLKVYMTTIDSSLGHLPYYMFADTKMARAADRVTGLRYIMLGATPAAAFFALDSAAGTLRFVCRMPESYFSDYGDSIHSLHYGNFICDKTDDCSGPGHSDFVEDDQHNQYLVTHGNARCPYVRQSYAAYLLRDSTHMRVPVEYGGSCREWWNASNDHVGGARNAPAFVISECAEIANPHTYLSDGPFKKGPYVGEVDVVALVNGEIKRRRIAATRSMRFDDGSGSGVGYNSEPHAAISPDGKYVLWTTNQGNPNLYDTAAGSCVFVAKTGYDFSTVTGVAQQQRESNLTLYPNPAKSGNKVLLSFSGQIPFRPLDLFIYGIDGELVKEQWIREPVTEINLSSIESGMYYVSGISGNTVCTAKLVIID